MMTGLFGFSGTSIEEMLSGTLWPVLVMGIVVMPLAWCLLSLAPRYTAPTNVSLLMLLKWCLDHFGYGLAPVSDQAR